ncbi:hypothetical protein [Polaribacter porphyrae]|uniref:Uncharacterized protein n=1 Tax=Polaribacter porphyrae TaxID=1137780 RepID=A0A2S7WP09_9FLAO|nr:hypothetical protein [Polaribacter porphyrae]PQJ79324.1 hypothetical protein BTO18_09130 [Polaribacter porphyrae]
MKKIKFFQFATILFLALTFSNCEEDGAIQFIVVDEFETNASVQGLMGLSSITVNQKMNISDLLDNASTFVEADVESVVVTLQDYSGNSISGTFNLTVGSANLLTNESLSLTVGVPSSEITIPSTNSDILSSINSGEVQVNFTGATAAAIADNDFTLNMKFKIKAKVE